MEILFVASWPGGGGRGVGGGQKGKNFELASGSGKTAIVEQNPKKLGSWYQMKLTLW